MYIALYILCIYYLCYCKIYFRGLMDTSSALSMLTPLPILIVQGSMSPLPPPIISQSYSGNILGTYLKRETSVELSFDIFNNKHKAVESFLSNAIAKPFLPQNFECTLWLILVKTKWRFRIISYFGIVWCTLKKILYLLC